MRNHGEIPIRAHCLGFAEHWLPLNTAFRYLWMFPESRPRKFGIADSPIWSPPKTSPDYPLPYLWLFPVNPTEPTLDSHYPFSPTEIADSCDSFPSPEICGIFLLAPIFPNSFEFKISRLPPSKLFNFPLSRSEPILRPTFHHNSSFNFPYFICASCHSCVSLLYVKIIPFWYSMSINFSFRQRSLFCSKSLRRPKNSPSSE